MRHLIQALMLFFSVFISAQVTVGKSIIGTFEDFKKGEYELIKKKTTVFVVDDLNLDAFNKMIKDVWTYNEYIVIAREDYNESSYESEKYAPFIIEGFIRTTTNTQTGRTRESVFVYHRYFYYTFKEKRNKIKTKTHTIAGIFYAGDVETTFQTIRSQSFGNMYDGYNNYSLGYLKNYFQKINHEFSTKGYSFAFAQDYDKKKMKPLKKSTLYIPEFIQNKYNAWIGSSNFGEEEREKPNDLLKDYDHPYEWISKEDLNDKILNATENFYYLMYVRLNSEKILAVMNGFTGEMIYQDHQTMSFNIKRKDLRRISAKVK